MDTLLQITAVLLPLLYLATVGAYARVFFKDRDGGVRVALILFRVSLAVHALHLTTLVVRWHQFPAATVAQALTTVAFAAALVYAFVEWRAGEHATGFWMLLPILGFEILAAFLRVPEPPSKEIFHDPLFAIHTSLGLLGYAAFVVSAGYGFLFLRLYREIKVKRFSMFFGKLPPLEVLDRLMGGALLAGLVALTGAVASGAFWSTRLFGTAFLPDPKIVLTLLTWAFYVLAVVMRRLDRWQGRQTAMASLAGLAVVVFSMLAVNHFFSRIT